MFWQIKKMLHCSHKEKRCNLVKITVVCMVMLFMLGWFFQEVKAIDKHQFDIGSQK